MYLRKYKFSQVVFLENTSQQPSLYIIWFRFLPKRKYYFMSEMYYSKPSQTSKMKLLAKVVNASRDVFKTVISIQNVFRTSRMALFLKIMNMNGQKLLTFSAKSSILIFCWVLKMPLDSRSIFTKNCILDFKKANMPLHVSSSTNLEMNKWN